MSPSRELCPAPGLLCWQSLEEGFLPSSVFWWRPRRFQHPPFPPGRRAPGTGLSVPLSSYQDANLPDWPSRMAASGHRHTCFMSLWTCFGDEPGKKAVSWVMAFIDKHRAVPETIGQSLRGTCPWCPVGSTVGGASLAAWVVYLARVLGEEGGDLRVERQCRRPGRTPRLTLKVPACR